jgi:ABC-type transport system involved in multi-copper enzyme maturation permease subunit
MSSTARPMGGAPEASPRARGARLVAYAPWQMRDYLMDRGAPTVLIGLLFGYMVGGGMMRGVNLSLQQMSPGAVARAGGAAAARAAAIADLTTVFLETALGNLVFLGALFAMNGIVANDRKQGFYRFLFSKPVSPDRYYGQAFVVHWAGFLVAVTALGLVYHALIGPVLTVPLYAAVTLMYLCYAGIAFALSAAARWDWLSLVAVTVASNYLWLVYGTSTGPAAWLLYLFPPIHRTSTVYAAVAGGMALPWHLLAWYAGYGATCFAIGLVVLRHRRLAII